MPDKKYIKSFLINDKTTPIPWKLSPELETKFTSPSINVKTDENGNVESWNFIYLAIEK